jgi:O-succinylbenzoate synthase
MSLRFEFRRYRLALRAPVRTAHGVLAERDGVLVRLVDEQQRGGYGEAAPLPGFSRETMPQVLAGCEALAAAANPLALGDAVADAPCLRGALAVAAAELATNGRPAVALAEHRGVAALLPAGPAAVARLTERAALGFRVFKWKVGVEDLDDELGWLDELCAVMPTGGRLRLDANGAWDRRRAERWLAICAERPVEFVEQPVAATARGAEDLLRGLAADHPTPIALDESLVDDGDVERWTAAGWRGVFVVKLSLLADADRALAALAAAQARVVFSSALETAVGARAALQRALGWPGEALALGFGVWPLFSDARFDGPVTGPFLHRPDLQRINPTAIWNALS